MRTIVLVAVGLSIFASQATGQSLAEVAKKEKKRREANTTPVTVIDEKALESSYSGAPGTESTVTSSSSTSDEAARDASEEAAANETPQPFTWPGTVQTETPTGCSEQVSSLRDAKREKERQYAQGFAFLEDMPRVKRSANPGYERAEMGFYRQTISMTCDELADNRARHREQYARCQDLERQIKDLERQITRKTAECARR